MKTKTNIAQKRNGYTKLIRILALATAIAIWYISIRFSTDGFNIEIPNMAWAGWVLGISITIVELVFNKPNTNKNMALWLGGLAAYAYGIFTNVVGIWNAQGAKPGFLSILFPLLIGTFIEILPEPLFAWALLGEATPEGDIVNNIGRTFAGMPNNTDDEDDDAYSVPAGFKVVPIETRAQKAQRRWQETQAKAK